MRPHRQQPTRFPRPWDSPGKNTGVGCHGVAKSRTRLRDFIFAFHFHALEKEMATHSSVLAWRIPGTGTPGGLPSMGSHRVGQDWSVLAAAAVAAVEAEELKKQHSFFLLELKMNINQLEDRILMLKHVLLVCGQVSTLILKPRFKSGEITIVSLRLRERIWVKI